MEYANIIVDITSGKLDRMFQYIVPVHLEGKLYPGAKVRVPFGRGNRLVDGYVMEVTAESEKGSWQMKEVLDIDADGMQIEGTLVALAAWIREQYGATMIQALKTVMPVKQKIQPRQRKHIRLLTDREETEAILAQAGSRGHKAKVRLLKQLLVEADLPYEVVTGELNISASTIKSLAEAGTIEVVTEQIYRNPIGEQGAGEMVTCLNEEQQAVTQAILNGYRAGNRKPCLIHGVTGSGKTEVYMELIAHTVAEGRQAIVLIPEIALTYQTVMRFYRRFGDRVSILNSRLSQGERYDQYLRAKNGEIDIMIGPRSALFTPFSKLGMIIIDEEHEGSYKSESAPRYHARETAIQRAKMCSALVVMGSATPSVDAYYKAQQGEYNLYELRYRIAGKPLPRVYNIDLREELKQGNRSILSGKLYELIEDRLQKKQQIILFLNRRGYAGFVSCRSCGFVFRCKNCSVSLADHSGGRLVCHYCGHEERLGRKCPECGSIHLGRFFAGTEQVEAYLNTEFPEARVLRMDADTTRGKHGHAKILEKMAAGEADILLGTQMIVKGHDFPGVTLVGILAADMSLNVGDYRAAERTFQLLTQAAGRAGRGDEPGEVVIQSYDPEHYSIVAAQAHDYQAFYEQEISYRMLMDYPPAAHLMAIHIGSQEEELVERAVSYLQKMSLLVAKKNGAIVIGPADAPIYKINQVYRKVLYIKHEDLEQLTETKRQLEKYIEINGGYRKTMVQFDVNPMSLL